jgi:hypothetical protein
LSGGRGPWPGLPPPDGSRDRRTDDPTNVWFVHLAGRLLLPSALRWRLSANRISVSGLVLGTAAALAYARWPDPLMANLGFLLCILWLVADGLDGMVARATGTTSAVGRFLDGACDHSVFLFLYLALAFSIGGAGTWGLALAAGVAHAVQATLYEGERTRFHRRLRGEAGSGPLPASPNPLVRLYDRVASSLDRAAEPFDRLLARSSDRNSLIRHYRRRATAPMRLMIPLTNNMRVIAIYLACLAGDPRLFWWFELAPLSAVAVAGLWWLRRVEAALVARLPSAAAIAGRRGSR